jgi:hypothetical protein
MGRKKMSRASLVFYRCVALGLSLILSLAGCKGPSGPGKSAENELSVEVSVDKLRVAPGDTVVVKASVKAARTLKKTQVQAQLFVPLSGPRKLDLEASPEGPGLFQGRVELSPEAADGFYGITAEAVSGSSRAFGKASFIVGRVVGDFMIVSALPEENVEEDIASYMKEFIGVGGNMIVVHDIIKKKALYPSQVCRVAAKANTPEDKVGTTLKLADKLGLAAFVTVSWDMTRTMPYAEYMASTKAIIAELWKLYGHHPCLLGFYSYQEGSGTYMVPQVREFSDAVKAQNKGLLAGCAPYIDDPLLAGYLASIDSLDFLIYQGAVMASFRPDNRKCFPIRRTRDFAALSAGALMQKNKICLSHVELFGYLERRFADNYLASYEDTLGQILSASTCYGADGITLFTYHYNVHIMTAKVPEAARTGLGVKAGLQAYNLISKSAATESSHIGLYIPYSDWWVDRWTQCFLPALDAFRLLGIAAEIVPFIPPRGEEILPYYPMSLNEEQLDYLLSRNFVLVLPDIAGMQETDSALLKAFVEKGGVAILFGPHIPYGDRFERAELCGGEENPAGRHSRVEARESLEVRVGRGKKFEFAPAAFPSWKPLSGKIVAGFEDGSAAVLWNRYGQGQIFTIPINIIDSVRIMPDLIRGILDSGLAQRGVRRAFDIIGADEEMDFAKATSGSESRLAIANPGKENVNVVIRYLRAEAEKRYDIVDLRTGALMAEKRGSELSGLPLRIGAHDFVALKIIQK